MQPNTARADFRLDLALVAFLIALDVVARFAPHVWGFSPVAASGLFAARMLRVPVLAVIVPVAAMALTGWALGADDWRVSLITYGAVAVPALLGLASRRFAGALPVVATMVAGSLAFFALSNFAVWAFSGMYPLTAAGLSACYVAALSFLDKTVLGDLVWTGVFFGAAWLVQRAPALKRAH